MREEIKFYRLLRYFDDDAKSITINYKDAPSVDYLDVFASTDIEDSFFDNFEILKNQEGPLQDILACNLSWIIISPRAQLELKKNGSSGYRLIDLKLGLIDPEISGYRLLCPLEVIAVLDREQSNIDWVEYEGRECVAKWGEIVIQNTSGLPDVFCIQKLPFFLVISSRIVSAWNRAQITGFGIKSIGVKLPFEESP